MHSAVFALQIFFRFFSDAVKALSRFVRVLISLSAALFLFLCFPSPRRPLERCVPERILKIAIGANRRRCRSEEALPVAAILAVGGSRPQRGIAMLAALGCTVAEGLLAEERLASRDARRRHRFRFFRREPERAVLRGRLRAIRRRAPAPRRGRIEASRELLLRC